MLPLTEPPENICLLRLSALGDVTHGIPVLRAIQAAWPDTSLTWVCSKSEHQLLRNILGVRFVVLDKSAGWSGYRALRRQLGSERFDVLLHMQVSARANYAATCVAADIRLGWDKPRSRDLHQFFVNQRIEAVNSQHQCQAHLSFARALGLPAMEPVWDFPLTQESQQFAASQLTPEQDWLLISPFSSNSLRDWSVDRYAAVADYAISQHNLSVVLTGAASGAERTKGEEIENAVSYPLKNLIGEVDVQQLMALLQRADIVLSPDSGPVHMANALGTPVIGLYACSRSIRTGPYNSLPLCVDKFAESAEKFLNKRPEDVRWGSRVQFPGVMDLINVNEVTDRLDSAVQQRSKGVIAQ